jgi:hypothetical protein
VSSALLGTERRPPHFEELPSKIQDQLGEGGLLDAAALATLYKRAGRMPLEGLAPLPAAEGEDRPLPRPGAVRRLAAMLSGFQTTALGEWLRAADERGWSVPPEHLPALADYARGRAEYRPLVVKAAGRRASWLADLNPDWRFLHAAVVEGNDPAIWTHGNANQRRSRLRSLRQTDSAAALEALREVWPTEPAATRLDFLGLLVENLSLADEAFCESALDDRSKEVRRTAAALLARIPGSQYGERMAQRVWSHLTVSQGVIAVNLPTRVDASMERDGVDPQQQEEGLGKRASWFRQIVAAAPLSASEPEHLQYKVEGCAPEVLQVAWAQAAVREGSTEWARALLQANAETGNRTAELLRVLPPDEWVPAIEMLRAQTDVADLVGGLPVPWPEQLAVAILDQLAKAGTARSWARLASIAARAVPAAVLSHPITREPTGEEDTWRRRLVETLIFRREMYEELS